MASLAWIVVRTVTSPVAAATFAAGITSGLLLVSSRKTRMRLCRVERKVAAMHRDSECRRFTQRLWATDNKQARDLFNQNPER